ncbi:hypothetical protein HanXRQr2_Chr16g0727791 [Helianthus annuus]|uniref:Uncharacterized protein n=1 Tax=Helianthus annuus TaxID=4232 RepID=A0A251RVZ3_HELAN|nr:hypothetical protein HanXRQr2_Chr16g0727791 [Helianthus annuus]KAJ0586493.1 hypothetical protein HanIR_Chr04g0152521 [Helianthus annuus]KAJ0929369.1 hypothetical protein HanPSC8_Chr04g0136881 [Helianthus annuus]
MRCEEYLQRETALKTTKDPIRALMLLQTLMEVWRNLRNTMEGSPDANHPIRCAASLPVLLCHGVGCGRTIVGCF